MGINAAPPATVAQTQIISLGVPATDIPASQPYTTRQVCAPSSFGSFPTAPLAIPANQHRVTNLANLLGV